MPRNPMPVLALLTLAAAAMAAQACSSDPAEPPYDPDIPATWAAAVDNPLFPLLQGTIYQFGGAEDIKVEVTGTRVVNGVTATEVRDRVFVNGELVEDTFDWYAQDPDGNVWYLGEDTKEYEYGQVVSTAGSWEWGVGGALPGIIMYADPAAHLGERYRQEYLAGVAEDFGKVTATNVSVTVPFGSLTGCVRTEDTSGLEPGLKEVKTYCPGLGNVLTAQPDGSDRVELTGVTAPLQQRRQARGE